MGRLFCFHFLMLHNWDSDASQCHLGEMGSVCLSVVATLLPVSISNLAYQCYMCKRWWKCLSFTTLNGCVSQWPVSIGYRSVTPFYTMSDFSNIFNVFSIRKKGSINLMMTSDMKCWLYSIISINSGFVANVRSLITLKAVYLLK